MSSSFSILVIRLHSINPYAFIICIIINNITAFLKKDKKLYFLPVRAAINIRCSKIQTFSVDVVFDKASIQAAADEDLFPGGFKANTF